VSEILRNEHAFDGVSITSSVKNRVVTLNGVVSSQAAKVLATNDIENVVGGSHLMVPASGRDNGFHAMEPTKP
jgi:osmotically-inducible protein OsmY